MVIELYCPQEATMTKLTKKQESLLNELLADFKGDMEAVMGQDGESALEIPRDRNGRFEPQVVRKGQRRIDGIDDRIIALYARGLSTQGIQAELMELYRAEVSPTLISNVTNSVLEEVQAWQARPIRSTPGEVNLSKPNSSVSGVCRYGLP
jgi:transposase-like protein